MKFLVLLLGLGGLVGGNMAWAEPFIAKHPTSVFTKRNSSVGFGVSANSQQGSLNYQWRLNGVNIPGAVDDSYVIDKAGLRDAGSYSVVVRDDSGAVLSQTAVLFLTDLPEIRPGDDFDHRAFLQGDNGILFSDNTGATREFEEPEHAGKYGDRSVWYTWVASFTGIASFTTRGSAFDTLLAAYSGQSLDRLNLLAGDDDNGGSRTSEIRFNAVKGEEYSLVIDGLGGDEGVFILSWFLEDSDDAIPQITMQPRSQTLREGDPVSFEVVLEQPGNYFFQWYLNGQAIPEAVKPTYELGKINSVHVGTYQVHIWDARQRLVKSQPATLELGPEFPIQSVDKALDLIVGGKRGKLAGQTAGLSGLADSSGSRISFSLGIGSTVSQTINNTGSVPEPDVAPHCAISGGADRWITLEPTSDGYCEIDTVGSAIDTVIAVYEWTGSILSTLSRPITCNDDIRPGSDPQSRVLFPAQAGGIYWVALDGREGEEGLINFNIRYGVPPRSILSGAPFHLVLPKGADQRLQAGFAPNSFPVTYRWWRDGVLLSSAFGNFMDLTNLQIGDSGRYIVEAANFAGATRNTLGEIVVDSLTMGVPFVNGAGHFGMRLRGDAGQHFRIEATSEFTSWTILAEFTFTPTIQLYDFVDLDAPLFPRRFYRVVPVWP